MRNKNAGEGAKCHCLPFSCNDFDCFAWQGLRASVVGQMDLGCVPATVQLGEGASQEREESVAAEYRFSSSWLWW